MLWQLPGRGLLLYGTSYILYLSLIPIIREGAVRAAKLQSIIPYLNREETGKIYAGTYVNPETETCRYILYYI